MRSIVIPQDYERQKVVPICIASEDSYGKPIGLGWIDGCVVAASGLRKLARLILQDEWRVSELADETLAGLWASRGEHYGTDPGRLILRTARWLAHDKRTGDRRARRYLNVELFDRLQSQLRDPSDLGCRVEAKVFCDRIQDTLLREGREDLSHMMTMYLADHDPAEIREKFGLSSSSFAHRFWRGIRSAAGLL